MSHFVSSVVARMFAPSVGTMMDGEHAFAASGGTAWRRRQRRLRAFRRSVLWHSKMEIAAALHHISRQRTSTTATATQTTNFGPVPAAATYAATASFSAPAPAIEIVIPSPVIEYVTHHLMSPMQPAPAADYVVPAPDDTYAAPAPVITPADACATPAAMIQYVEPAPVIELNCVSPFQQLPPVHTMATDTTNVGLGIAGLANLQRSITAVEVSASQVDGSRPVLVEATVPIYNQDHQEQLVASEQITHVPVPQIQDRVKHDEPLAIGDVVECNYSHWAFPVQRAV